MLLKPRQGLQQRLAQLEIVVEGFGVVVGVEVVTEGPFNLLHENILGRVARDDEAALQRLLNGGGELVGRSLGVAGVGCGVVGHYNGRGHVQQHIGAKARGVEIISSNGNYLQSQPKIVPGLGAQRNAGGTGFEGP